MLVQTSRHLSKSILRDRIMVMCLNYLSNWTLSIVASDLSQSVLYTHPIWIRTQWSHNRLQNASIHRKRRRKQVQIRKIWRFKKKQMEREGVEVIDLLTGLLVSHQKLSKFLLPFQDSSWVHHLSVNSLHKGKNLR